MTTFTSAAPLSIPNNGVTSQSIVVSGLTGKIITVSVTLNGLTTLRLDDLDFLLVGPDGIHNLEFLSDAGGTGSFTGTITISDSSPTLVTLTAAQTDLALVSGTTYAPRDFEFASPETA